MSTFHLAVAVCAYAALSATALMALARIVRGPTILDRMIASDVLLTTLMLAVGTDMFVRGHTETISLMIVIAATSVFATITVARYVKRRGGTRQTLGQVETAPEEGESAGIQMGGTA